MNLDYDELKRDTKLEISERKEESSDNKPIDLKQDAKLEIEMEKKENGDSKPVQKMELKLKDNKTLTVNKPARIPMKEMHEDNAQGQTTGDATPSGGGPSTEDGTGQQKETPPVREQRMGSCTIQLVRVPGEKPANIIDPKDRLWWVTQPQR